MKPEWLCIANQILQACLRMQAKGFFLGTWGNISVRVGEGLLVTPSRVDYDTMEPEDMVWVSLDGNTREGHRLPSSETELHRAVYRTHQDIAAVVHSHPVYASAMAALHRGIPPIVEDQSQIVGGMVPCTRYIPGDEHVALAEETVRVWGNGMAVLLANHGLVCGGMNLPEALVATEIVEKAAAMYLLAAAVGQPVEIPADAVVSERARYLYKYGKE